MAENRPEKKGAKRAAGTVTASAEFSAEERAAMREHIQELKAEKSRGARGSRQDTESVVLARVAAMAAPDRVLGERLHAIVKTNAPTLSPKLWYGMPAYANQDGSVICFFQDAQKFKSRYATLGFTDKARLDEGRMWPTSFALKELGAAEEAQIVALIRKAVS